MSSLTRWVLAHKRIVVIGWIALTIAGIAASGPASKRLANDSSVPAKEGWETTVAIAQRYDSNPDGGSVPLLPVVTPPAGTTVDSPGVKAEARPPEHPWGDQFGHTARPAFVPARIIERYRQRDGVLVVRS